MSTERTDEVRGDLDAVRQEIRLATKAVSISEDGHSLTRQSLGILVDREAQLEQQLAELLTRSVFRRTTFVRPIGLVQSYPYWRGQRYGYDSSPDPGAIPRIAILISSGLPVVTVGLTPPP